MHDKLYIHYLDDIWVSHLNEDIKYLVGFKDKPLKCMRLKDLLGIYEDKSGELSLFNTWTSNLGKKIVVTKIRNDYTVEVITTCSCTPLRI